MALPTDKEIETVGDAMAALHDDRLAVALAAIIHEVLRRFPEDGQLLVLQVLANQATTNQGKAS